MPLPVWVKTRRAALAAPLGLTLIVAVTVAFPVSVAPSAGDVKHTVTE